VFFFFPFKQAFISKHTTFYCLPLKKKKYHTAKKKKKQHLTANHLTANQFNSTFFCSFGVLCDVINDVIIYANERVTARAIYEVLTRIYEVVA
jgi:hypothetical protein